MLSVSFHTKLPGAVIGKLSRMPAGVIVAFSGPLFAPYPRAGNFRHVFEAADEIPQLRDTRLPNSKGREAVMGLAGSAF